MGNTLPKFLRGIGGLTLIASLALSACGGGGGGSSGAPPTSPPTPTPTPNTLACPTSGSSPTAVAVSPMAREQHRRAPSITPGAQRFVPGQLAVTYQGSVSDAIDRTTGDLRGDRLSEMPGREFGIRTRVISVNASKVDTAIARLKALPGVRDVARVSYVHRMSVAANDPYYVGFSGTSAPFFQTNSIPGQWDMHAISLDGAWSQFASAPIIAAPIAIIDTGVDVTHPELITPSGVPAPKIIRTQCFVTYPESAPQSTGTFVTDTDGHGTNVAGIADGNTDNSFGFVGAAFDAPILAYRIFPTDPSGGCEGVQSAQCETTSADEASAMYDAVSHGAKVINLSLGAAPPCPTNDPMYQAVEYAIAHNVVVVAAAGNGDSSGKGEASLVCPAADPGVIAAGASALNDSGASIVEYVAYYSNYLTNNGTAGGGAFLVAPGGDPCSGQSGSSCNDSDNLHWIEHIYSSTGITPDCSTDFAGESGNCRILIAGTSQATPHIAGVASLMLAKNPNLTPAQVAAGLCATADNINDAKQGCGRLNAAAAVTWASTH